MCRQDIETCQAAGKIILLSLGGATGNYSFSSASQASTFANTLWDLFGGGNSSTRPFGTAVIDGFDLGTDLQSSLS
jgi:chitinase